MDATSAVESKPPPIEIPAYRRPALRPMQGAGFRIYCDQKLRIDQEYSERGSSELVRALLDKFFRGEIPDIKEQLKSQ